MKNLFGKGCHWLLVSQCWSRNGPNTRADRPPMAPLTSRKRISEHAIRRESGVHGKPMSDTAGETTTAQQPSAPIRWRVWPAGESAARTLLVVLGLLLVAAAIFSISG